MNVLYNPGDVIVESYPFVKVLLETERQDRCNNCFKRKDQLQPCPTCELYQYCCLDCKNEDWNKGHAVECKSGCFRLHCCVGGQVTTKRFLFRMYAYLKLDPEAGNRPLPLHNGNTRCLNDLVSHREHVAKDLFAVAECGSMAMRIKAEDPESDVTIDELVRLMGIQRTNGFSVWDEEDRSIIGCAIYVEPAIFNHSCKPTARFQNFGLKLQIRAIYPVLESEEPFISYLDSHMDKLERQKELRDRYYFDCQCIKCNMDEDLRVDYDKLLELIDQMQAHKTTPPLPAMWTEVVGLHMEILKVLRLIYFEYDDRITIEFSKLLNIALKMRVERNELKQIFSEAFIHTKVTHGKEHPFYLQLEREYVRVFPEESSAASTSMA